MMNWTTFQTHNDDPRDCFEVLCNQLFENWVKEEYKDTIKAFSFVNGAVKSLFLFNKSMFASHNESLVPTSFQYPSKR